MKIWLLPEVFYLLGYNAIEFTESQPTFWRNISPLSSVSKMSQARIKRESRWQAELRFHAGFLLGLFLDPEDRSCMFL
jgi:hypothetical protein